MFFIKLDYGEQTAGKIIHKIYRTKLRSICFLNIFYLKQIVVIIDSSFSRGAIYPSPSEKIF